MKDGDTLRVQTRSEVRTIRLSDIDAPEKRQAFGDAATRALIDLCLNKNAQITYTKKDRYGRTIGRVVCDGVDVQSALVKQGAAWVYPQYCKDNELYLLEHVARAHKIGLWGENFPLPPWEWRHPAGKMPEKREDVKPRSHKKRILFM